MCENLCVRVRLFDFLFFLAIIANQSLTRTWTHDENKNFRREKNAVRQLRARVSRTRYFDGCLNDDGKYTKARPTPGQTSGNVVILFWIWFDCCCCCCWALRSNSRTNCYCRPLHHQSECMRVCIFCDMLFVNQQHLGKLKYKYNMQMNRNDKCFRVCVCVCLNYLYYFPMKKNTRMIDIQFINGKKET